MRTLAKRTLIFLFVTATLYGTTMVLLSRIMADGRPLIYSTAKYYKWPGGVSWFRFKEYDPTKQQDAVIIGSSHAQRGYDPRIFSKHGYRVFNLGSPSQTPSNSYYLIQAFLDSLNAPLLIFDAYSGVLRVDGLESASDLIINQPNLGASAGMAWALGGLRAFNLYTLRLFNPDRKPLETPLLGKYLGLGYISAPDSIGTVADSVQKWKPLWRSQSRYFQRCIQLCKERQIQMVVTAHFARSEQRGTYHRAFVQYMDSLLAGTNIPFLDFTDAPGIQDKNWFMDSQHLNTAGAVIFTELLIDSLESRRYLRKHNMPSSH